MKCHIASGTRTHRIYAIRITPGESGDAPQAPHLLRDTRRRNWRIRHVVADNAYASRIIATTSEALGLQPTLKLRKDATQKSQGHPAWPRMVRRHRENPEAYARKYHERSNVESTNFQWKNRLGERLCARHPVGQHHELRFKAILHNLGCPPEF